MTVTLEEFMKYFTPVQRAQVEARASISVGAARA
jgi:hypothetical protein